MSAEQRTDNSDAMHRGDRNSIERKRSPPAGDQQRRGVCASSHQFRSGRRPGRDLRLQRLHQGRDAGTAAQAVYKSIVATIDKGAKLDPAVADAVAVAMKDWALEKGATHYAHVFYPMTGLTAEKHDSFLEPVSDGHDARRVRRQDPDPGRARRLQLPVGRSAQHLRGPRLHRLGRHQPRLHPGKPERQHAVHPDGVRLDDR